MKMLSARLVELPPPARLRAAFRMRRAGRTKLAEQLWANSDSISREQALLFVNLFRLKGFEEAVRVGLSSRSVKVRIAACSAAAGTGLATEADTIADLAIKDPSYRVRLWAIQALKHLGDPRWRPLALESRMVRLNAYERADWKHLVEVASGTREDKWPNESVCALRIALEEQVRQGSY